MRRELFSTLPFFLNDKSCQAQAVVLKASQRAKKYFRVKKSSFKIVLCHSENLKIRTWIINWNRWTIIKKIGKNKL